MFGRPRGVTFRHSKRDLTAIYGAATQAAGPGGTDSLDLLSAALSASTVAKLVRSLGVDPAKAITATSQARVSREPAPGLTDDAKRVIEAVSHRALERRREPSGPDLLLSLAAVDTAARRVLNSVGIDEARVRALVG
jgi:hypothetical protein